jgi:hypothetical protein
VLGERVPTTAAVATIITTWIPTSISPTKGFLKLENRMARVTRTCSSRKPWKPFPVRSRAKRASMIVA